MEAEEKANIFSEKFLDNCKVTFVKEHFDDRKLNPRGWQYKKYGNSTKGEEKLKFCRENMKLLEDNGKCARNDSDPRYYQNLIFADENNVVEVSTSPSRAIHAPIYSSL